MPNFKSLSLVVLKLLVFNSPKFKVSRDPGLTPFSKKFLGTMSRLLLAACMPNLRQLRQIRRSQGRIQEFSLGGRDGERFA